MDLTVIIIAVITGILIGFSMGTVGGGGAIMAVPALVYAMGQSPLQATTASLVIVGVTAIQGGLSSLRRGVARLGDGLAFGLAAVVGAVIGASLSHRLSARWLMAGFVVVLAVTVTVNLRKILTGHDSPEHHEPAPLIDRNPLRIHWQALTKFVAVATGVGLLTGLLGVGGGFMIVPALTLVVGMTMHRAAGTSLVVMVVTSAAALTTRLVDGGMHNAPSWPPVILMTGAALVGSVVGGRVAHRASPRTLSIGFTVLIALITLYTVIKLVPEFG